MARPTKAPHEKRTAAFPPVRVTDAELYALHEQAEAVRLSPSEFIRQRVLSGRITPPRAPSQASLIAELNRIGVNLNQIARQVNRGRAHDPHHLDHVLHELTQTLQKAARSYGS